MRTIAFVPALAVALMWPMSAAAAAPGDAAPSAPSTGEAPARHGSLKAVGLTDDQRLVEFHVDHPSSVHRRGKVGGLHHDTRLVGIDYRVQDEKLYGVGDKGGVYTLHPSNARATKVSQLTVALHGQKFGVDFNPAADRLRVISDTGQNLRHNIDDEAAPRTTTADGTLTNPLVPPAKEAPTALGVTGAGYTNNDLDPRTATSLFDVDTDADRVSLQSPANAGNLAPTGGLGVDAGPSAGFDVYYDAKAGTNQGFGALHVKGGYGLYSINLLTGAAHRTGAFPAHDQVVDLALPLDQGAARPSGGMAAGGGGTAATGETAVAGAAALAVGALATGAFVLRRRSARSTPA